MELILEHARPTKGGFAEQCNQGHEKPKKPKSFQKWQKYGFIKLKLKVHPFAMLSHSCFNTIFTSDDSILYDRIDRMVKINFRDCEDQSPGLCFRWEKIFIYWPRYCLFTSRIPSLETRSDYFDIFIILTFFRTGLTFTSNIEYEFSNLILANIRCISSTVMTHSYE